MYTANIADAVMFRNLGKHPSPRLQSLTFSVRNDPGRYALLLGSGVSTGAGVPTGWAVVEDLIRKLAAARKENPDPDLFEWYKEVYGEEAAYDDLIGELADSQEERRSLLEDYFEPSEEERDSEYRSQADNPGNPVYWFHTDSSEWF